MFCAPRGLAFLFLGLPGCLSPEQAVKSADDQVYALIDARREELFSQPGGFRIEPEEGTLRDRVLSGDWSGEEPWSLVDCLEIAAENNRQYRSARESLYLAALDLTLERFRFTNIRGFGGNAGVDGSGGEADSGFVDGGGTLSRLLGGGAQIVSGIGASLFRLVRTGDGWDTVTDLSLSVTQPLLGGGVPAIIREPLTQAERTLIYEVRDYERFRREFGFDVAQSVYSLLQAIDQLRNEKRNYQNLVNLSERTQALSKAGRISQVEADQATQNQLRSESSLVSLEANVQSQRDNFLLFLGLPIETKFDLNPNEFDSLQGEDPILEMLDFPIVEALALNQRLDVQTARDEYVDSDRRVNVAADALRANLDVSLSGTAVSDDGKPLEFSRDGLNWSGGISLDLPIDRIPQRNAYRTSLIAREQAKRAMEQAEDQVTVSVRDALRDTFNARDSYVIQVGAVALAERRVEGANLSQEAGRSSTRDVLEAQEALLEAQNSATTALINFTLARLNLYLQVEALRLDESGLSIDAQALPGPNL